MSATFAAVFVALYAAHLLGDHVVQTDHQAGHKAEPGLAGHRAMFGHVAGYTVAALVALVALLPLGVPLRPVPVVVGLLWSSGTHWFIDRRWPVQWVLRHTRSSGFAELAGHGLNGPYLTDQSLHVGCLFVAAWLVAVLGGVS